LAAGHLDHVHSRSPHERRPVRSQTLRPRTC
jgi:hypothetical protein